MADFTHYWQTIRRSLVGITILSMALSLMALAIAHRVGPTFEVHYSYLVSLSEREEAPEYRFDGFYALQATDLFSQTLAQWMTTPEVIVAAYTSAGLEIPTRNPRALAAAVSASKSSSQLVTVTIRHDDEEVARRLADGLKVVMNDTISRYHDQGIPALTFRVVTTDAWLGVVEPTWFVIWFATFFLSFFFFINMVLLRESFNEDSY